MAILLWQQYNEQGRPVLNGGIPKLKAILEGTLHGSSHVWIWRRAGKDIEILVQRRATVKINWPGLSDKSAGGHIAYREQPVDAAVRKAKEELGIRIAPGQLKLVGVRRWHTVVSADGLVENEFQWIYLAEVANPNVHVPTREVATVEWKSFAAFRAEACVARPLHYVPYGRLYFALLCGGIMHAANQSPSPA